VSAKNTPVPPPSKAAIDALLEEKRIYPPSGDFRDKAVIRDDSIYAQAASDFEGFWAKVAGELDWFVAWDRVLDWKVPDAKWFVGGKINASYNCLDRHIRGARRNKAALIWIGEPGDRRTLTYWDLYREVNKFANALRKLGVAKGDRVAIYMPMVPELPVAMLACARIGAVHSVVFGGFSAEALRDRINDAQARVLITADGGWRRGQVVPLKHDTDEALKGPPSIRHVVVVKRGDFPIHMTEGRDHWWHRIMDDVPTTAGPSRWTPRTCLHAVHLRHDWESQGHRHTTGGYMTGVYATTKWVFDLGKRTSTGAPRTSDGYRSLVRGTARSRTARRS
jgi:acetyl-CoA synthetase